jgi:hypothetical protein
MNSFIRPRNSIHCVYYIKEEERRVRLVDFYLPGQVHHFRE